MTDVRAYDLHAIAARFRAAGIDEEAHGSHHPSLSAECWAARCRQFGLDPEVVIRRILIGRVGESEESL